MIEIHRSLHSRLRLVPMAQSRQSISTRIPEMVRVWLALAPPDQLNSILKFLGGDILQDDQVPSEAI